MTDIAGVLDGVIGGPQLRISAYDGSVAGPAQAPVHVRLNSELGLRYLVTSPGELGLARAYVTGELDVDGYLYDGLRAIAERPSIGGVTMREKLEIVRALGPSVLRPVPVPPQEVVPGTRFAKSVKAVRRHVKSRDAAAISHHYDVSNTFYRWVLGPSMAYTCACYPTEEEKFDLVCRKLDLQPGQRLLDVGCGWGGMVRHAVTHYGVSALGVTLSRQQAEWAQKAIAEDASATRPRCATSTTAT